MRAVKEYAYAKVNLFLDVVSKRDDGFHDIKTVMHSVSLADILTVSYAEAQDVRVTLKLNGNRFLPTDDKNLAVRAAKLFLKKAGIGGHVNINLVKRIPVAAGLAGGSSDAAAVLRALNKLLSRLFGERALYAMGAELGSDVPYCIYGKTALCEGRGEILTRLPNTAKFHFVVAVGREHVSTPEAYGALDKRFSSFDGSISTGGEAIYPLIENSLFKGTLDCGGLFNVFEHAVLPHCKKASWIKEELLRLGAKASLMSGSGPSVFGVFEDEALARLAAEQLSKENVSAYYAHSV